MNCGCEPGYYGLTLANDCCGSSFFLFMSLVDAIIRSTCDVSDVCGRIRPKYQPRDEYDFIVIGGGSGGSAVTGRLAEWKKYSVLLLEAGMDESDTYQVPGMMLAYFTNPLIDWGYRTSNEPNACQGTGNSCLWLRGKVLGGCSSVNGMMYMRGSPPDYNVRWRDQGGLQNWGWNDVLPFYKKFENNLQYEYYDSAYHAKGGPVTVSDQYFIPDIAYGLIQGAEEAGFPVTSDINGANFIGFTINQSYMRDGVRVSMASAYLRPQRGNHYLDIMLNSTVTRILVDQTKRAYAVEFIYRGQIYRVRANKEIILAAGTVNSPQILLNSGIGPKDALDTVGIRQIHNLPGVGHNLTNHVAFTLQFNVNTLLDYNFITWTNLKDYINQRTGPLANTGIPVTTRLLSKYASPNDPDIQMFFSLLNEKCSADGKDDEPVDIDDPTRPKILTISVVNLQPKSRGRITLKTNNPLDPPNMVGNYLTVRQDEDILIDGIRLAQRLVNTPTLKNIWQLTYKEKKYGYCGDNYRYDSDDFWRCAIRHTTGPENHQASSLRMGLISDKWSVVDEELRVIGIKGLRVSDGSAMPVTTSSNTNAPIVVMGERCANFIKKYWS